MLHVRFRLIATPKIKEAVYKASKERRRPLSQPEERGRKRKPSGLLGNGPRQTSTENGLQVELPAQTENRQPSPDQAKEIIEEGYVEQDIEIPEVFNESFINDPGKASRLEQLWIEEIARQRPDWERRFLHVCEFFDGRTTFDEIQYRSQLKRSQFRQIAREYDPWLLSLLHP